MGNSIFQLGSFRRAATLILLAVAVGLTVVTCDTKSDSPTDPTGDTTGDTGIVYGDSVFTHSPLKLDSISGFVPLGNLNPPGHTFPTDHCYLYLANSFGSDTPPTQTLFCPGRLRIGGATASEHVNAGFTDYSILFELVDGVTMQLGHVSSLSESIFGDVSALAG